MNFLNFAAFGLLGLIPVVILLYLLKLKRKPFEVSSTLLWFRAVQDLEANAPFQRLRRNLLLLLQLLILLLLIFALARPYLRAASRTSQSTAIILDGSASMQATDAESNRFDFARKKAEELIRDLSEGDQAMLILSRSKAHVLQSLTANKDELLSALRSAEPADTDTDLTEAFLLAQSLLQDYPGGEIAIFSDGIFPSLPPLALEGATVRFVPVGSQADNLAITALDVRPDPSSPGSFQVFASITNFGPSEVTSDLELYLDDAIADSLEIKVESGQSSAQVFRLSGAEEGVLKLRLTRPDDLAVDNEAQALFAPVQTTEILLAGEPNYFLQRILSLDPRVKVSMSENVSGITLEQYDLIFFSGRCPTELDQKGNYVFVNCAPENGEGKLTGPVRENPPVLDWDRIHPLMRFVDLENVSVSKAFKLIPPPASEILIESSPGPLAAVSFSEGRFFSLYLAFDLYDSNWMLRAAFPIFVTNLVDLCRDQPGANGVGQHKVGRPVPIFLGSDVSEETIEVLSPQGKTYEVPVTGDPVYFASTEIAGLYQVRAAGRQVGRFALNLLSLRESNIQPSETIQFGNETAAGLQGELRTNREIWKSLTIFACLLLFVEWWVYHRRIGV